MTLFVASFDLESFEFLDKMFLTGEGECQERIHGSQFN